MRFRNGVARFTLVTLALVLGLRAVPVASAATTAMRGRVTGPDGLPLPGVLVTASPMPAGASVTTLTDTDGVYVLDVPAGRYRLTAELSGFRPADPRDVAIAGDTVVIDLSLLLGSFQQQVTVSGETARPMMGDPAPEAPVSVTREVIDSAMLPNSQYDDVLPLMPNVVRGPDGLISVAGARAPQGALLVNGFNETDPISGTAGVMLPIESVDSVQVYSGGYAASFGRSTGGVTSVVTRAGADQFHMSASSFFPRMLFTDGGIRGVAYWEPNAGVSGPLVKGRAHFEQGTSYRFDRNRFGTLIGEQRSKFTALLSWTQVDVQVSPAQHVLATFSFDPQRTDRANISAFTPAASVPRLEQGGWSAAIADRVTLGTASSLELRGSVIRTRLAVIPNGSLPYQLAHDVIGGNYFDHQDLNGRRIEAGAMFTRTVSGAHLLNTGVTIGRAVVDGLDVSAPVDLLRSDGTLGRRISFLPGQLISASTYEVGAYAQDTWTASPWLTIDAGVRYDRTAAAPEPALSPRVGWTIKAGHHGASLSGSAGLFADKLLPEALAFPLFQARAVQAFDGSGAMLGPPIVYTNALSGPLRTPRATRWDVQFDRHFADGWLARAKYQERHGRDELVVSPSAAGSNGVLALGSTGRSSARSAEATVGYRAPRTRRELYVSYVRSSTRGDLNSFDAVQGPFKEAFIQPDEAGPLPMDVPNRVLAWGVVHLPARFTVAPFVEIRNGFPYSSINEDWTYAAPRNGERLPWFGSADLYVNTIVGLPRHLPHARVGLKLYNLASVHSARDIQRDVTRPDFGTTYNTIPRDFTMVFELLWGHS